MAACSYEGHDLQRSACEASRCPDGLKCESKRPHGPATRGLLMSLWSWERHRDRTVVTSARSICLWKRKLVAAHGCTIEQRQTEGSTDPTSRRVNTRGTRLFDLSGGNGQILSILWHAEVRLQSDDCKPGHAGSGWSWHLYSRPRRCT